MNAVEWSPALEVDDPEIDSHHRQAAEELNGLMEALERAPETLLDRFDAFIEHCRSHFAHEEALMKAHGFPALPVHQAEHERALAEFAEQRQRLIDKGPGAMAFYFRIGLKSWFISHVQSMDSATVGYVNAARSA